MTMTASTRNSSKDQDELRLPVCKCDEKCVKLYAITPCYRRNDSILNNAGIITL